jgi:hypothetical protein
MESSFQLGINAGLEVGGGWFPNGDFAHSPGLPGGTTGYPGTTEAMKIYPIGVDTSRVGFHSEDG